MAHEEHQQVILTRGQGQRLRAELDLMGPQVDPEVAWRLAAMRPQVPVTGAIPLLIARPGIRFAPGSCGSCGDPLAAEERYRCRPCVAAAVAALEAVG